MLNIIYDARTLEIIKVIREEVAVSMDIDDNVNEKSKESFEKSTKEE